MAAPPTHTHIHGVDIHSDGDYDHTSSVSSDDDNMQNLDLDVEFVETDSMAMVTNACALLVTNGMSLPEAGRQLLLDGFNDHQVKYAVEQWELEADLWEMMGKYGMARVGAAYRTIGSQITEAETIKLTLSRKQHALRQAEALYMSKVKANPGLSAYINRSLQGAKE